MIKTPNVGTTGHSGIFCRPDRFALRIVPEALDTILPNPSNHRTARFSAAARKGDSGLIASPVIGERRICPEKSTVLFKNFSLDTIKPFQNIGVANLKSCFQ